MYCLPEFGSFNALQCAHRNLNRLHATQIRVWSKLFCSRCQNHQLFCPSRKRVTVLHAPIQTMSAVFVPTCDALGVMWKSNAMPDRSVRPYPVLQPARDRPGTGEIRHVHRQVDKVTHANIRCPGFLLRRQCGISHADITHRTDQRRRLGAD